MAKYACANLARQLSLSAKLSFSLYLLSQLLGVMVPYWFLSVCNAFILVRHHGKTNDRGQLFVNSQFSQFLKCMRPGQPPFIPYMLI